MSSLKSDQDILRVAQRLGIREDDARRVMDPANYGERWELATRLVQIGRGAEDVARNLEIPEEALRGYVADLVAERRREEERRNATPSWLEDPPS